MESYRRTDIQAVDQQTFEQMLHERLRDPTPGVMRRQNIGTGCESGPLSLQHHSYTVGACTTHRRSEIPTLTFMVACSDPKPVELPQQRESHAFHTKQPSSTAQQDGRTASHSSKNCNGGTTSVEANKLPPLEQQPGLIALGNKRNYVLQELLDTECVYVKDLEILVAALAIPLCKYAGPWATRAEQMLQPLQVLFSFQYRFLKSLHNCSSVSATAQLFSINVNQFETYIDYCGAYHWLNDLLDRLRSDSDWSGFINAFQERVALYSDKRRLSIDDFLIKPVQRICKYPLFLRDLLKYTDANEEPNTSKVLEHALSLLRGICDGVNQVQQRIDSLKLRHRLISNYSDNPELPLRVVSKLGEVVLSGPLYIAGCGRKCHESPRLLGCVLFGRFLLILKSKRARMLVPQFWFPLHTMQVVDDGLVHSWRLVHNKSGQFMVFQAKSPQEKQMWIDALGKAVAVSVNRIKAKRAKYLETPDISLHRRQHQQQKQRGLGKEDNNMDPEPRIDTPSVCSNQAMVQTTPIHNAAAIAADAAVAASPLPRATCGRRFWQSNPLALTRVDSAKQHFKEFSSTEILRLHTAEALRQDLSPKSFPLPSSRIPSPPRFPFLAASLPSSRPPNTMADNGNCTSSRPSDSSCPSHVTAVENEQCPEDDNYSDEYGAFSADSTYHELNCPQTSQLRYDDEQLQSTKQNDVHASDATRCRSLNDTKCSATAADYGLLDCAKSMLSDRLFGALGHLTHIRCKSTSAQEWIYASDHINNIPAYHSRSFSAGC
ncbi:hypothetical protein H4R24_001553 [Coemansia sp. RSA 988]|nr:hypothetical protein H4R24_001553 [Coemansia sp. RSA 988]